MAWRKRLPLIETVCPASTVVGQTFNLREAIDAIRAVAARNPRAIYAYVTRIIRTSTSNVTRTSPMMGGQTEKSMYTPCS